jgi:SAM-dependent methyltransferase
MNRDIQSYYARRAPEYDRIYDKPERQADLSELKSILSRQFKGLRVLEIACGTGYWTQYIARSAASVHATDYNPAVLQIASGRAYSTCPVTFAEADAFAPARGLPETGLPYTAAFAGFLWSHIPLARQSELIVALHSQLAENALVVWLDGRYVAGSSTPIDHFDAAGNSYQVRALSDGSRHEVIKNYPSQGDLAAAFTPFAANLQIQLFQYFWLLSYNVKKPAPPPEGE